MIAVVIRVFALLSVCTSAGIALIEFRTAIYQKVAERIWAGHSYPSSLIQIEVDELAASSPSLACSSGASINGATIALRALDNSLTGRGALATDVVLPLAAKSVDAGLACQPLSGQLWLARFWVHAMTEGFRVQLRDSFDRSIACAPYEGWVMRLRALVGSRWFYALNKEEQLKVFEDLRYTVDLGFLEDALTVVERLGDWSDELRVRIEDWPPETRNRLADYLMSNGVDLKIARDPSLKPWQHP
jgi:hypothetical protein